MNDVGAILGETSLFSEVHKSHRRQIAEVMEPKRYQPGEIILGAGEVSPGLFLVVKGTVGLFARTDLVDAEFEEDRLGKGGFFGELSLLSSEPSVYTARAVKNVHCLLLPRTIFEKICEQLPSVLLAVASSLASRLNRLRKENSVPFISLSGARVDPDAYRLLPQEILRRHKVIPLYIDNGTLVLGMVNPGNLAAYETVKKSLSGTRVRPVAISESDYLAFEKKYITFAGREQESGRRGNVSKSPAGSDWRKLTLVEGAGTNLEEQASSARVQGKEVVALLNQLLAEAIDLQASDLHLDPDIGGAGVRFRIDGRLSRREHPIPSSFYRALVSRIKIVSGLDIAERRHPQDGRMSMDYRGRRYDVRVATMPALGGEHVAMRFLEADSARQGLPNLVLAKELVEVIRKMIFSPVGAIMVTGPTGSGKTTTLYSLMTERMNIEEDLNIVTVEDPIEYSVPGITQVQVNEAGGLTFPDALRGFLRHDPDVIMIGETRDEVTARIAMEAALTGHLVLTSMHTNSAINSIIRLREMGIPKFLIANATLGVIAQRLVRRCCPMCSEEYTYSDAVMDNLRSAGIIGDKDFVMVAGRGCEHCGGTGFKGRVGVYEVLQLNSVLRNMIAEGASTKDLEFEAEAHGMVTLRRYARFLLQSRLTVPGEVLAILAPEQ
ncbi:MAG: Flp pilus assembly complex ATPase component [Deltaproteobacteria bacterium]|nr:Flp pilus assembly complex ATPase component [Deltaproteobacteria bacterium]